MREEQQNLGPADTADFTSMIISAVPSFWLAIQDIFGPGDRAVAWLRMSAPTPRRRPRSCGPLGKGKQVTMDDDLIIWLITDLGGSHEQQCRSPPAA